MMAISNVKLVLGLLFFGFIFFGQVTPKSVELDVHSSKVQFSVSKEPDGTHINEKSESTTSKTTFEVPTKVEIAVYVISCLGIFLVTLCCFYCCKHCCWDGCRGEASVTYRQMPPTARNTGTIVLSEPTVLEEALPNEATADMIPLQGMKKVKFSTNGIERSPNDYESLP